MLPREMRNSWSCIGRRNLIGNRARSSRQNVCCKNGGQRLPPSLCIVLLANTAWSFRVCGLSSGAGSSLNMNSVVSRTFVGLVFLHLSVLCLPAFGTVTQADSCTPDDPHAGV